MNTLLEMLLAFGPLNRNELSLLKKNIKQLSLNTDDFYLQAGEISKDIAFIETGVLRLFYFDKNGQDFTLQFLKSKTFIVETNSFENKIPTSEYIQCLTKSTLSVLTSEALFNFSKNISAWNSILGKLLIKIKGDKILGLRYFDEIAPVNKYLLFKKLNSDIIEILPSAAIATFLNIPEKFIEIDK